MGIFSYLLMDTAGDEPVFFKNENFGTLMRTKESHSNEGGVTKGYAVLDQPVLIIADDVQKINENVY